MTRFLRFLAVFIAAIAVAGCSGSVAVAPEDIRGTIVDGTRAPLPGVQVLVGDTLTTTDEAGHFTVHDVSPPYDLAIATPSFGSTTGNVYLGMTDPTPTVLSRVRGPEAPALSGSATLSVVLPAADTSTLRGFVVVDTADNLASVVDGVVNQATGPVRSFKVDWVVAPTVSVRIHAFQVQVDPATFAALHYVGYDTTDLVLDGQNNPTWSASYKPPPFSESPLSCTVSMPEGYTMGIQSLSMRLAGSTFYWTLPTSSTQAPELSFVVPDLAGALFSLTAIAGDNAGASGRTVPGLTAGTKGLAVQVDHAPTLTSPLEGATFGVGSTVTWTLGGSGAPYTTLSPQNGMGPSVYLWGGDGSATVPDLSALGLELPHSAKYTLEVNRESAAATVEDFASVDYTSTLTQKPSTFAVSAIDVTTP